MDIIQKINFTCTYFSAMIFGKMGKSIAMPSDFHFGIVIYIKREKLEKFSYFQTTYYIVKCKGYFKCVFIS